MQQELVREDIGRMGHKIRNAWNITHRITGNLLSFLFLGTEPAAYNNEMYHTEYEKFQ
jgi:hypothetical protein